MDANIAVTQLGAAGVVAWGLQLLKQSKYYPWLTRESASITKRLYSVACAIGVHTGIAAVWNAGTPPVGFRYQLIINIPPIMVMLVTVWHWAVQFMFQEGWYQTVITRMAVPNVTTGKQNP